MGKRILLSFTFQALLVSMAAYGCAPPSGGWSAAGKQSRAGKAPGTAGLPALVRKSAHPLKGGAGDYDPLMKLIGDARFVLLGEATHGTHEFYRERARITRRLIEEKGFGALVIEADWPDAHRVAEYVRGRGADRTAEQSLSGFTHFPRWMWRNTDFHDLVQWMRTHNDARKQDAPKVGVHGMDLYSLSDSADAVVEYLRRVDPAAGPTTTCSPPTRTRAW